MSKHDGASKEYRISSRISNIQSWIFWINISICLVAYVFPMFISKLIFIAQIVLPILYCLLAFINNNYFWYSAEKNEDYCCLVMVASSPFAMKQLLSITITITKVLFYDLQLMHLKVLFLQHA